MIIFENIETGETMGFTPEDGPHYRAMMQAYVNSSSLGINADRGQNFGWELIAEQRAIIDGWMEDGRMAQTVADFTSVPSDSLSVSEYLEYLLHREGGNTKADVSVRKSREDAESAYRKRVEAARAPQKNTEDVVKNSTDKK